MFTKISIAANILLRIVDTYYRHNPHNVLYIFGSTYKLIYLFYPFNKSQLI